MNGIDEYRKTLVATFPAEARRSLAPAVLERLRLDSTGGDAANFAFGIYAFATMAVPAIAARSAYKWSACLELSNKPDALVNRTADMNGADGLIKDASNDEFRYAARVRRAAGVPMQGDAGPWGLNVRLASGTGQDKSSNSEYKKLDARVEASKENKGLRGKSPAHRLLTENPAFQITAIVDHVRQKLISLRMASGEDVVAAVETGLDSRGKLALHQAIEFGRLSKQRLETIKASCAPGLFVEEMEDAVFLWIADGLVPKYRIGPSADDSALRGR